MFKIIHENGVDPQWSFTDVLGKNERKREREREIK